MNVSRYLYDDYFLLTNIFIKYMKDPCFVDSRRNGKQMYLSNYWSVEGFITSSLLEYIKVNYPDEVDNFSEPSVGTV